MFSSAHSFYDPWILHFQNGLYKLYHLLYLQMNLQSVGYDLLYTVFRQLSVHDRALQRVGEREV